MEGDIVSVVPTEIRYSQCSISGKFSNGERLNVTLEQLLKGVKTPEEIELIEVVWFEGAWWCLAGHRRLYLYKLLRELDFIHSVYVKVRDLSKPKIEKLFFDERKTTTNDGETMRCRGKETSLKLCETIDAWEQATGKQRNEAEQRTGKHRLQLQYHYRP